MATAHERLVDALSDRYRLEEEIGRGGMAVVYRAWDLKNHRTVAIKVLHEDLSSAVGVERFLREIQTTGNLTHPHILPLYDSDATVGFLYYVMPFSEAGALRKRLAGHQQLDVDEAVRITCEVADGLSYAHSRGIIHRDIKPDNILFLGNDRAVIGDFGIARAVSAPDCDDITATGVKIGTPAYMSPEQVAGEELDGRTDIYSLGCVLYEMLVASTPFSGPAQAVMARKSIDPVPPIRTVRPTVPEALERVVLKALARTPADRFATAGEFAAALRNPVAAPAFDVRAESIAVLPFTNLSPDPDTEYFSDGLSEEIINALARIPGLQVAARTSSFAFRGKAIDLAAIGGALKVATVLEGSVRRSATRLRVTVQLVKVADGYQLWSESYDRDATDVFQIQEDIAHAVAARLQATWDGSTGGVSFRRHTENLDAYHLYLKGRYHWEQRGVGLKTALECFSKALALDPSYALAHAGLADACILLAEYGVVAPREILPKARAAIFTALDMAPDLAEAHSACGELKLVLDWDWRGAAEELQLAIKLNPRDVVARYRLAVLLSLVAGRFEEAGVHARRAVELDPLAPLPHSQLGLVLMAAGRYEEAIPAFRQAIDLAPFLFLPNFHLGVLYHHMGRMAEAINRIQLAADVSGRHPTALTALANCLRTQGDADGVTQVFDELTVRARREYVAKSALAVVAAAAGRVDEAFQLLAQACDDHDYVLIYAKRHPGFSLLQSDPRIDTIYRRVGFQE
ncbi:MAG TPA: protein kinase [Gemmatimonadales bacterium]|nr:protein kinase [Gemmatimonadales bacterium]